MDTETLLGTWLSVGSEIPEHMVGTEAYHFFAPDIFLLEFYNAEGQSQIGNSRFAATPEGFRYGGHESMPHHVVAWIEDGYMIWRPEHGMETWFSRASSDSLPEWVRGYQLHKAKKQNDNSIKPT